jgi:drug resistance transporter, EmrB/QacA subfamily
MGERVNKRKSHRKNVRKRSKALQNKRQFKQIAAKAAPSRQFAATPPRSIPHTTRHAAISKTESSEATKAAPSRQFVAAPPLSVPPATKHAAINQTASPAAAKPSPSKQFVATPPLSVPQAAKRATVNQIVTPAAAKAQDFKTAPTLKIPTLSKEIVTLPVFTVRGQPIRPWLVLGSLVFGFFMSLLDTTIVNIAIPTIQANLKTNLDTVSWILTAYNLIFAVLLVTLGRFADQYGRKRMVMISMVIFSAGSLLCALAGTMGSATGTSSINWLIAFRVLQGVGGAGLNPISLAIIIAVFPPQKRGAAIGVWGALSGLASAIGPVLGGFLVETFDWRYIFLINLPFCVVGLIMVALFVPETSNPKVSKHIDVLGIIFLSIAIFCLVLAITQGNSWGWTSIITLSLYAGAVLAFIIFVLVEMRQQEPIIDFHLFKTISFTGANITMFLFGLAIQGQFLIMVLFFQNALGFDQLHAAYAILPAPLTAFLISIIGGRFSRRINSFYLAIIGMVAITIGFLLACFTTPTTPYFILAGENVILGFGIGLIFQSLPNLSMSEVPPPKLGVASGVFNTFRQIGYSLGIAILLSMLTGQIQSNFPTAFTNSIQLVQQSSLPAPIKQNSITGLQKTLANSATNTDANNTSSSIDLTRYVGQMPPQTTTAQQTSILATLHGLSAKINDEFAIQITNAFTSTWWISSGVALVGVLTAVLALLLQRKMKRVSTKTKVKAPAMETS